MPNRFLSSLLSAGSFACVNGSGICFAAFIYSMLIGDPENMAMVGTIETAGAMLEHYRLIAGARYFLPLAGALWLAGAIYLNRRALNYAPPDAEQLHQDIAEFRQAEPAPVEVPAGAVKRLVKTESGVLRYVHVQGG